MSRGNESAYPLLPPVDSNGQAAAGYPYPEHGLTKREAFAMAAMQGILASTGSAMHRPDRHIVASASTQYADAVLAKLAEGAA